METDPARLRPWLGRTEEASNQVALERVRALQVTLERPERPLGVGDPLPPLWHWLFFWPLAPRSGLGRVAIRRSAAFCRPWDRRGACGPEAG